MAQRWEKHQFCGTFDGEGPASSVWQEVARGLREDVPNEVPVVDGCEGLPLSPPSSPLMVTVAEFVLPRGIEATPRRRGTDPLNVSLMRPGRPVGDGKATPRTARKYTRRPSRRRSISQRLEQRNSDCRLHRRLASVGNEGQSTS